MDSLYDVLYASKIGSGRPRASLYDNLLGKKLYDKYAWEEKTVDWTPVISVSDALAKPVVDYQCKITAKQTGTPSPQNICPITGWTGANIGHATNNIYKPNGALTYNRYINVNTEKWLYAADSRSTVLSVENGKSYCISLVGVSGLMRCAFVDTLEVPTNAYDIESINNGTKLISAINTGNHPYLVIQIGASIYDKDKIIVTEQEPTVYPVSWQSEAGTVYGGVLDATTGTLTVTHALKTYTGSSGELWNYSERDGNRRVFIVLDGAKPSASDFWSNIASGGADSSYPDPWEMRTNGNARPSLIIGVDNTIGSVNDWKALLADTNMIVVYPLATPITYTLTPTEIALVAGANTLWADTGDSKMTYKAKKEA